MNWIQQFIDLFIHLDVHLTDVVHRYGTWSYAILFVIIFCETGLVLTPILPGDSLLFAAGAIAALGHLNLFTMMGLMIVAALTGDVVNYSCGRYFGSRIFKPQARFLKTEYLERTQAFYAKYGPKTIVLARFVPFVRTFAPFVAGMGRMPFRRFISYSISGAMLWVTVCTEAGYWFGNIPYIKNHFSAVILGIIFISVLPTLIGFLRSSRQNIAGK